MATLGLRGLVLAVGPPGLVQAFVEEREGELLEEAVAGGQECGVLCGLRWLVALHFIAINTVQAITWIGL